MFKKWDPIRRVPNARRKHPHEWLGELAFPSLSALIFSWHLSLGASIPLAVRLLVLPLALTVAIPARRTTLHAAAHTILPFATLSTLAITALSAGATSPDALVVALVLSTTVVGLTSLTTSRTTTLATGALATLGIGGVALIQQHTPLMVLSATLSFGVAHLTSRLVAELAHWRAHAEHTEERLNLAIASGHSGLFDVDIQSARATFSPRFREVLGYDGFAAFPPLPDSLNSPDLVWSEDIPRVRDALLRASTEGHPMDLECRFVTAMGLPLWVRLRGTAQGDEQGFVRVIGSILDISARKSADDLAESFLHAASTQIRAPLTSIRGVHRLVTGGAFGQLPELATKMMTIADRNSARLEALVDQLIDLRRLERGRANLHLAVFDIADLVHEAATAARAHPGNRLLVHPVDVHSSGPIRGDRGRLLRVLRTLMTAGSDQVSGRIEIHTLVERRGDVVLLHIRRQGAPEDAGITRGISEVLSRTSSTVRTDFTTLGLAVARALIVSMGGMLVTTRPTDTQLEFRIDFEMVEGQRAQHAESQQRAVTMG